jgi:hypothetical protein
MITMQEDKASFLTTASPQKQPRTSPLRSPPIQETIEKNTAQMSFLRSPVQEIIGENTAVGKNPVEYWTKEGIWPKEYFEPENNMNLLEAGSAVSGRASTDSRRKKSLVEDLSYRETNLIKNHIYLRSVYEKFPEDFAKLVDYIRQDRDLLTLSSDQLACLERLKISTGEPRVENYSKANVFPDPVPSDSLQRTDKNPMAKHAVPDFGTKLTVGNPAPDMLYGYNRLEAFTDGQ